MNLVSQRVDVVGPMDGWPQGWEVYEITRYLPGGATPYSLPVTVELAKLLMPAPEPGPFQRRYTYEQLTPERVRVTVVKPSTE